MARVASIAIGEAPVVRFHEGQQIACPAQLSLLRVPPVLPAAGVNAVGPSLRQELIQQNEAPSDGEQRVQQAQPRRKRRIRAVNLRGSRDEASFERLRETHPGVQKKIAYQLHWIIPAKIFKVDEGETSRTAYGVVKTKIGRAQAAPMAGQRE